MDWWVLGLLLGLVALGTVDGYPNEDLVLRLPGQPKVDFRQFAGYVDVNKKSGRSLFYYFAEADGDAENKPLTLWLNGGPGCSSIGGGAFTELGPFFPRGDGRSLRRNPRSWNKVSNLLFVESPAGVGWSYSNTSSDYTCGDSSTANDMLEFLMGWYEKFHEFKSRDLFLTGESYAGHYIPQLAIVLLNHNKHSMGFKFKIKGVAATKMSIGVDVCMTRERDFYFNLPEVQHALHANRTNLLYKWVHCTDLLNYNQTDGDAIMVPFLKRIIQHGIPVWIYSGDQDSVIPVTGSRRIIRELAHDLNFKITVPYGVWFHKGQVGGWATEYGNLLTFATVRGAGHMVPYAQPGRALLLFKSFISGKRLPNTTHPSIY
ncbi:serine carboxypeptidase-like 42 isoform X3 [Magnolia sinica]|uniref:serine carboxypeptidase-like 42 isoform X3 n=1 Tax=Magnolia sinica TaxID=86752 RepID=UPI00265A9750|nr:serine carboxypeptidase-like 42 isoform X3 [Magnolia sinica]